MLTFEKVFETFADFLAEDDATEVAKVKHGYLVMFWDDNGDDYDFHTLCQTPHELMDALLKSYSDYLDYVVVKKRDSTLNEDPTDAEKAVIAEKCAALRARCLENSK